MSEDLFRLQSGDGSKFNSSLADLERIHNLLIMANQASIYGDYPTWLSVLKSIDREISPYLNEKEEQDMQLSRISNIPSQLNNNSLFENKLNNYERKLRYYRSAKKLGIVAGDDASTAALR